LKQSCKFAVDVNISKRDNRTETVTKSHRNAHTISYNIRILELYINIRCYILQ